MSRKEDIYRESDSSEDESEEPDPFLGSPHHNIYQEHRISSPRRTPPKRMTPSSGRKQSPGFVLSRSQSLGELFAPLPFQQPQPDLIIDVESYPERAQIATRESLAQMRAKADEYKQLLEEKKKALEESRKRDLLVQRIKREEASMNFESL